MSDAQREFHEFERNLKRDDLLESLLVLFDAKFETLFSVANELVEGRYENLRNLRSLEEEVKSLVKKIKQLADELEAKKEYSKKIEFVLSEIKKSVCGIEDSSRQETTHQESTRRAEKETGRPAEEKLSKVPAVLVGEKIRWLFVERYNLKQGDYSCRCLVCNNLMRFPRRKIVALAKGSSRAAGCKPCLLRFSKDAMKRVHESERKMIDEWRNRRNNY